MCVEGVCISVLCGCKRLLLHCVCIGIVSLSLSLSRPHPPPPTHHTQKNTPQALNTLARHMMSMDLTVHDWSPVKDMMDAFKTAKVNMDADVQEVGVVWLYAQGCGCCMECVCVFCMCIVFAHVLVYVLVFPHIRESKQVYTHANISTHISTPTPCPHLPTHPPTYLPLPTPTACRGIHQHPRRPQPLATTTRNAALCVT